MDPEFRLYPERLQPWTEFLSQRDMIRDKFSPFFAVNDHIQPSCLVVEEEGGESSNHPLQHLPPAYSGISHVDFWDRPDDNRMAERAMADINGITNKLSNATKKNLRPCRICTSCPKGGPEIALYPVSVIHATRLTRMALQLGLRPMDFHEQIIAKTDSDMASTSSDNDRLVGAAVAQTFHYMICSGVEYGLLTTGETFVFLKVDWTNPSTLYYHIAPSASQILPFTLIALEGTQPTQRQRHRARELLRAWDINSGQERESLDAPSPPETTSLVATLRNQLAIESPVHALPAVTLPPTGRTQPLATSTSPTPVRAHQSPSLSAAQCHSTVRMHDFSGS